MTLAQPTNKDEAPAVCHRYEEPGLSKGATEIVIASRRGLRTTTWQALSGRMGAVAQSPGGLPIVS
jgi:hypothetical protein